MKNVHCLECAALFRKSRTLPVGYGSALRSIMNIFFTSFAKYNQTRGDEKSCPRKVVCVLKKAVDISAGSSAAVNDKKTIRAAKTGRGRTGRIVSAVLILFVLAFVAYFAVQSYSYEEKAESMFSGASFVCAEVHNDSV